MDGENNGKPPKKLMIWGVILPLFLVQHPILVICFLVEKVIRRWVVIRCPQ